LPGRSNPLGIVDRPQVVDAVEVSADKRESALAAAGRYQELVICQRLAIVETDLLPRHVKLDHPAAEQKLNSMLLVIGEGRDQRVLENLLAAKERL
jgi:hypothetical protein